MLAGAKGPRTDCRKRRESVQVQNPPRDTKKYAKLRSEATHASYCGPSHSGLRTVADTSEESYWAPRHAWEDLAPDTGTSRSATVRSTVQVRTRASDTRGTCLPHCFPQQQRTSGGTILTPEMHRNTPGYETNATPALIPSNRWNQCRCESVSRHQAREPETHALPYTKQHAITYNEMRT